jgi:excisionase family DNA binding protein
MQENLLTVGEVAQILHFSRSYIYWLMRRGELKSLRFGTSARIHPDDLETYIRKYRPWLRHSDKDADQR